MAVLTKLARLFLAFFIGLSSIIFVYPSVANAAPVLVDGTVTGKYSYCNVVIMNLQGTGYKWSDNNGVGISIACNYSVASGTLSKQSVDIMGMATCQTTVSPSQASVVQDVYGNGRVRFYFVLRAGATASDNSANICNGSSRSVGQTITFTNNVPCNVAGQCSTNPTLGGVFKTGKLVNQKLGAYGEDATFPDEYYAGGLANNAAAAGPPCVITDLDAPSDPYRAASVTYTFKVTWTGYAQRIVWRRQTQATVLASTPPEIIKETNQPTNNVDILTTSWPQAGDWQVTVQCYSDPSYTGNDSGSATGTGYPDGTCEIDPQTVSDSPTEQQIIDCYDATTEITSLTQCLPTGWSVLSPAAYVKATACVLRWAFIPPSSSMANLSSLWGDMKLKVPFSWGIEIATFIPNLMGRVSSSASSASCANMIPGGNLNLPGDSGNTTILDKIGCPNDSGSSIHAAASYINGMRSIIMAIVMLSFAMIAYRTVIWAVS